MIVGQELYENGDEYRLVNHINTDDIERENWKRVQQSHLFIAMNKPLAKYAGLSLEKYIKADNLSIVYTPKIEDGKGHNVQARTEFIPERRNIFGDIEQEAQTIIRVSQMANQSSIIHEMGHIFLRKLQRLAQSGQLKGLAKQDWDTLRKNYGISKLDFNNMSDADLRAWTDTHEKFATDFERYMMTGEAPSSKMKHIFEQFKRWLTDIYHSIQNIKYVGSDGQEHAFELSPEMKEVFDHLLGEHEENENYKQTLHNLDADNDFITPEQIEHFNQLAFHGTGHIIENNEFKLSKVASGEGTQYQGYGIYLAENRAVPEHYRGFGLPNGGRGIMYVTMNDGTIYGSPDEGKWNNLEASEFREALEGVRQYAIYQPNLSMKEVLDDAKKNISEYLEEAKNSSQNTPERIKTLKAVVQKFLLPRR